MGLPAHSSELLERTFAPERARIDAERDAALAAMPLPFVAAEEVGQAVQELREHVPASQIARRAAWLSDDLAEDFRWFSLWTDTAPGFDPCVFAFGGGFGGAFGVLLHPHLQRLGVPAPVVYATPEDDPPLLWVAEDFAHFEVMIEAGTRSSALATSGTKHAAVAGVLEGTSEERRLVQRRIQEQQPADVRKALDAGYTGAGATFASASLLAQGTMLGFDARAKARREELRRSLPD